MPNENFSLEDFTEEENLLSQDQEEEEGPQFDEEELKSKSEEDLTEEEKEFLNSKKTEEEDDDEEEEEEPTPLDQLTEEEIEELRKKKDPTEEEKAFLEKLDVEEEEDDDENFWEKVEAITGVKLEVDYGDIDPLTPAGAAKREEAVVQAAIDGYLVRLQKEMPKVYKALEHAYNGGEIEDLFKPGEKDYSKIEIKDEDEEHAKSILTEYYSKKGIPSSRIKRLVEADEDSEEGVIANAREALKEMATVQSKERDSIAKKQEEARIAQQERDKALLSNVDSLVEKGNLNTFIVPKAEREEFSNFVKGSIQRDGREGYLFIRQLNQEELEVQLQYEYLRFKKGNLDKIATIKSTTSETKKLGRRLGKSEKSKLSGASSKSKGGKAGSMKEFEE